MASEQTQLHLNGKPHAVAAGSTLADLITALGRDPRLVAVERNGSIVPRDRYPATLLEPGDRLEVVQFVQGGASAAAPRLAIARVNR